MLPHRLLLWTGLATVAWTGRIPDREPWPPFVAAAMTEWLSAQGADAEKGMQCPAGFDALFDVSTKVLRCRRETTRWVVTSCPDKDFQAYVAKIGPDRCGPTEIAGVGTPPGARHDRPVECAALGYATMLDRTGQRDRCERVERLFVFPRVVP